MVCAISLEASYRLTHAMHIISIKLSVQNYRTTDNMCTWKSYVDDMIHEIMNRTMIRKKVSQNRLDEENQATERNDTRAQHEQIIDSSVIKRQILCHKCPSIWTNWQGEKMIKDTVKIYYYVNTN